MAADPSTAVSVKYLYSLYWSLTTLTTVGYGDVTPKNDAERLFTSVTLLLGGLVFGYMLGNVSSMMNQLERQDYLLRERMDVVKDYVTWRNMPPCLAMRIKSYYAHFYNFRPVFDGEHCQAIEGPLGRGSRSPRPITEPCAAATAAPPAAWPFSQPVARGSLTLSPPLACICTHLHASARICHREPACAPMQSLG